MTTYEVAEKRVEAQKQAIELAQSNVSSSSGIKIIGGECPSSTGAFANEFLATLSHELRTPLTSILGWSRLLHSNQLSEQDRQRAIQIIQRNAESQAKLIEDLLEVSRIITGKLRSFNQ